MQINELATTTVCMSMGEKWKTRVKEMLPLLICYIYACLPLCNFNNSIKVWFDLTKYRTRPIIN